MSAATVILNVEARSSTGQEQTLVRALEGVGVDAQVVAVRGAEVLDQAGLAASNGGMVIAAGGDGTVSTVAAAAVNAGATFGVLPLGTRNNFARDAGIPLDLRAAVAAIVRRHTTMIDVGEVNGRVFVNNASVGAYPRVVWEREIEQRRGRGKWTGFAIALWRVWRRYRLTRFLITIDDRSLMRRTPFVLIGNGDYQAEGLAVGTRSSLDSGRLSVFVAPECGRFEALALPVRALTNRLAATGRIERFTPTRASIDTRRSQISVTLDGELMLASPPLRFTIRRRALRLIRPAAR